MPPRTQLTCNAIILLLVLNAKTYFHFTQIASRIQEERQYEQAIPVDPTQKSIHSSSIQRNTTNTEWHEKSWIGDYWIPSSRLYSAPELRNVFAKHGILFVGDSTARRLMTTLYHILNSTDQDDWRRLSKSDMSDTSIIDVNRRGRRKEPCHTNPQLNLCRTLPQNTDLPIDYIEKRCNSDVIDFFQAYNATTSSSYSLIVVAYGSWHQAGRCKNNTRDSNFRESSKLTLQLMKQTQRNNLTIVWRSMAMIARPSPRIQRETWAVNRFFLKQIQKHEMEYRKQTGRLSSLTALDWGYTVGPRSIPLEDRIQGDNRYHWGFEPRLVFLQMLTHHLIVRQSQQRQQEEFILKRAS